MSEPELQFEKGVFRQYKVVGSAGLHIGAHELTLPESAVVDFDGSTLKYGGEAYTTPAVRGAIKAGWLVPAADSISHYIPKPAGVRVKAAQSTGTEREDVEVGTATEEERVVGDLEGQQEKRQKAAAKAMATKGVVPEATVTKGDTPVAEAGEGDVVAKVGETLAEKFPTVVDEGAEGVVVGQATKEGAGAEKAPPASQEGTPVGGVQFSSPKQGPIDMSDSAQVSEAKAATQGESKLLGKPAPPERVKGAEDIKEPGPGGATGDATEATVGDDLTDLLPDAVSTGKPEPTQTGPSADNFEWSTKGQWKARVKTALQHADNPDVMRKILAAETPAVRGHIEKALERGS